MKKIKLFLAAMAAMVTMGVNAQSWTAPTIQGEDPVAGTQYKVMNVGAGTFLDMGKAWFSWNTTAILSNTGINFTMTADGDNWKFIRTGTQGVFTSGNDIAGDAMHVDNTAHTYGITKLANGYYHIHDAGGDASSLCWGNDGSSVGVVAHADATASGWNCEWVFILPANVETAANLYSARLSLYNEYLKANAVGANTDDAAEVYNNPSATIAELNAATTALYQTRRDHLISIAKESEPQELTEFFVVNADFSTGDGTGWTRTGTWGNQQFGTGAMESWNNNNVSVTQDLTGIPNGRYRVSCDMISGNDGRTAYVYAKGMAEVNGENVSAQSSAGNYNTMSNEVAGNTVNAYPVFVDNHTLTIGFKDPSGWVVVDNFKVFYYGKDLTAIKEALQANIDAVAALESTTTTAAYNAAKTYADEINMDELTTEEAIAAASAELNTLVDAAKALQNSYANYNTVKTAILNINSSIDLSDAITAVEAATTVEGIETGVETARAALKSYLASVENAEIDLTTALLINPGFELGNTTGWTNSGALAAQAQGNKAFDNTQDNYYAERWHASGTVDLNQTLTAMPAGYYQLSAYIYSEPTDGKLYANSTNIGVSTSKLYTIPFKMEETGDIKFGASCTLTNSTWFCMDGFKLEFLGTAPLSLYQGQLADAVTAANAHADALEIPAGIKSTYTNAISTAAAKNSTIEECVESITDIEEATATADAAVKPYATYLIAAEDAAIVGVADETLSEQNTAVAAATTVEGVEECTAALRTAIAAMTSYDITAATITNATPTSNADGWICSVAPNAFDAGNNNAEFWNQSAATMKQTITLPAGTYCLTVIAFQRINCVGTIEAAGKTTKIVDVPRSTANNRGDAKNYFNAGNGVNTVYFTLDAEQEVTIGINADGTTDDHWTVWRSFKLETFTAEVAEAYATAEALAELEAVINAAPAVPQTNIGDGVFQIPATGVTAYSEALEAANAAKNNNEATSASLTEAKTALEDAIAAYNALELNAPDASKVYNIINISDGYNHKGKAVTFKSASNADLSSNSTSMGYTELPGSYYPQGVTFTAVEGVKNGYTLSYTRADGNVIYVGTGSSTGLGNNNSQLRPTTDASKAVTIQVKATSTDGVWNLYNTLANQSIGANGANDQGFYTTASYSSMAIQEAANNEVHLQIAAVNKYGTLIVPFDAPVPTYTKAYSVSATQEDGTTLELSEVSSLSANTPYIIEAQQDGVSKTLSGLGAAYTDATYKAGLLTGVYETTTATTGTYVLQNNKVNGKDYVAFYLVKEGEEPTIGANRAYLTAPSAEGVKAFFFPDMTTAIQGVFSEMANGNIYDLQGRKVQKMQKGGVYVINGQKVTVK